LELIIDVGTSAMNKTVLSFLAHPDDAEILCGGTLVRLAEAGWSVHIATATAGDCGTMTQTPWEIGATRTQEGKKAAESIGATYHCLGEKDIYVCYDQPTLQKTVDLFRRVAPSLVFTHPAKDYMMDHEMVHLLARAASFGYGAPNATTVPLRPGSHVPHLYYCDPIEGLDPQGNLVASTTVIDITAVMDKKSAMLACHASQREWLRAQHGMDEYVEAMKRHGILRGKQAGLAYAEAFVQHLGHAYPHDDVLVELLGSKK
jgi:LmbE family N-acetylglucosaminyl deacetylase